ncbi:MAG: hypothetical protein AB8H80_11460 [Planctomycetota bacterium]
MPANYLVCRTDGHCVLIPSESVLGVRELPLSSMPPVVPDWVDGVGIVENAAVIAVHPRRQSRKASVVSEERDAHAGQDTETKVVVLHPHPDQVGLVGVVVSEVVALESLDVRVATQASTDRAWLRDFELVDAAGDRVQAASVGADGAASRTGSVVDSKALATLLSNRKAA